MKKKFHKCFKKIRIKPNNETNVDRLMNNKTELKIQLGKETEDTNKKKEIEKNIEQIDNELSDIISDKNAEIIREHLDDLELDEIIQRSNGSQENSEKYFDAESHKIDDVVDISGEELLSENYKPCLKSCLKQRPLCSGALLQFVT